MVVNSVGNTIELDKMIRLVKKTRASTRTQKPPIWFSDFVNEQREFNNTQLEFNKRVIQKLDKHDQLFEMVLDQFKKHKWIK